MLPKDKLERLDWVCRYLDAPYWLYEELKKPKRVIESKIRPVINGRIETIELIRVQYCNPNSTGVCPYKGGLRYHPGVTKELMEVLSFDMTKKCALAELRFGGAKGGLAIDPLKYKDHLRVITETAAQCLWANKALHPDVDVPGPDMGTNSETMFWIYNKMGEWNADFSLNIPNVAAIVTGKPIENDGCPGREDATARGGLIVLQEYLNISHTLFKMVPRVIIQGFGNVGHNFFKLIPDTQFNVVGISDVSGGIYLPEGLDFNDVKKWHTEHGSFSGFPDAREVSNSELLLSDCDILVPAAIENQVTGINAGNIKARIVLELANEAVTSEGYYILKSKNIPVIPGIVANTGGVVTSFIEWSRNRGNRQHKVDLEKIQGDVENQLIRIMSDVVRRTYDRAQKESLTMDEAADILALETLRDQLKTKHNY